MVARVEDLERLGQEAQEELHVLERAVLRATADYGHDSIEEAGARLIYAQRYKQLVLDVNPDLIPPADFNGKTTQTRLSTVGFNAGKRFKKNEAADERQQMEKDARDVHRVLSKVGVDQRVGLMDAFNAAVMSKLTPVLSTMITAAVGKSQGAADGEMAKALQWFDFLRQDEQKNVIKDIRTHGIKSEGFHVRDGKGKALKTIAQFAGTVNATRYNASTIDQRKLPPEGQEIKGNGITFSQPPKNYPFALGIGDPLLAMFAGNATVMKVPAEMQDIMDTFAKYWNEFVGQYAAENQADLGLDDDDVAVLQKGKTMQVVTSYGHEAYADNVRVVSSLEVGRKVYESYVEAKTGLAHEKRELAKQAREAGKSGLAESYEEQAEAYEADAGRFAAELAGANVMYVGPDLNGEELRLCAKQWLARVIDNNGMICTKIEDGMVHEFVAVKFQAMVREEWQKFDREALGKPHSPQKTDHGVHTDPDSLRLAQAYLDEARLLGAEVVGGHLLENGLAMTPAMVFWPNGEPKCAHVRQRMKNVENFAPVSNFMSVSSVDEAIEITNTSQCSLTCSLWTKNPVEVGKFIRQTKLGSYNIFNKKHGSDNAPFGEHRGVYHHVRYVPNERTGEVELHIEDNGATGGHSQIFNQLDLRGTQNAQEALNFSGDTFAALNGNDANLAAIYNICAFVEAGGDLARDTDIEHDNIRAFAAENKLALAQVAPSLAAA